MRRSPAFDVFLPDQGVGVMRDDGELEDTENVSGCKSWP